MIKIPIIYIKDKQAFSFPNKELLGKPIDICKEYAEKKYKLIHIIDLDGLIGSATNMDIYDNLTYFINIEVEIAPKEQLLKKLLSIRARVVISQKDKDLIAKFKEKNLFVAKLEKDEIIEDTDFLDIIIQEVDEKNINRIKNKRIIIYQKDIKKLKNPWGVLLES